MTITEAKKILESNGCYINNLWHVDDVKELFDCSNDEAQEVLNEVMTKDSVMEHIWVLIKEVGNNNLLKHKQ